MGFNKTLHEDSIPHAFHGKLGSKFCFQKSSNVNVQVKVLTDQETRVGDQKAYYAMQAGNSLSKDVTNIFFSDIKFIGKLKPGKFYKLLNVDVGVNINLKSGTKIRIHSIVLNFIIRYLTKKWGIRLLNSVLESYF